jgi:hypothetical protein
MTTQSVARGLGLFSIGLGLTEVIAPKWLAKTIGAPPKKGLIRWFGVREILTGIAALVMRRPAVSLWGRVAGDVADLGALGFAFGSRCAEPRRLAAVSGIVAGVTALDIMTARALKKDEPEIAVYLDSSITNEVQGRASRIDERLKGLQTVSEALLKEPFPLDREGVYYAVGSVVVSDPFGRETVVRDLLDKSPRARFETVDDVLSVIQNAMCEY